MQLCPRCGAPSTGGPACASCGALLPRDDAPAPLRAPPAPAAKPAIPAVPPAAPEARPLGVLLVGVGFFLLAVGCVLFALLMMVVGSAFVAAMGVIPFFGGAFGGVASAMVLFLALAVLVVGVLVALVGYGVIQGYSWAWAATLVVAGLGALLSLLQLADADFDGVLGVLAWGGVAYYFLRPETRAWFGRAA